MTIKIGTIHEMTGEGFEILVDTETRTYVLAKFFDGNLVGASQEASSDNTEATVVTA